MTAFRDVAAALEKELSARRYRHSLAVARLAGELARRHGWEPAEARMAGLVHDCAKEWRPDDLIAYVRRRKLAVPDLPFILKTSPGLLHAYVSAAVARERGWIETAAQARAVSAHTLGRWPMGVEESVLFIADLAAYDRKFPEARRVRAVAKKDLRAGLREALRVKFHYQLLKSRKIHPMPVSVWNRLLEPA
jgi:predicted HD superfamily hydrolase involved in NAD metabolism